MRYAIFCQYLIILACVGCGSDGPTQYAINGEISYGGKPVPAGIIRFQPDRNAGNDWKASVGEIHDGKYDIASSNGVIGGAYLIYVFGHDGVPFEDSEGTNPLGKPLFETHEQKADLQKASTTLDITIPAN
ncbi:hypothetical protein [Calycomorphotria hydatis]|uniref:Nickel uptake substrate-specific transmembrane region n=1 Tax=Calycomorphotria hydatis TaxID=2528027 RepID=A0A517TF90_9PLAN|nr:hypothetical protein [Calycomorphotria hydatis]QDT67041.1 hypothetical protein V22_43130 [Calycomorphotria hydatis]